MRRSNSQFVSQVETTSAPNANALARRGVVDLMEFGQVDEPILGVIDLIT